MKALRVPALLFVFLLLAPRTAGALESDFQAVVGALESQFGVPRTHLPFAGLASLLVRASGHSGVHELEFATLEQLRHEPDRARRFSATVRRALGDSWQPLVQVRAPLRGAYTGVYLRGAGGQVRMLIATLDDDDATVVELRLDAVHLRAWLHTPERMARQHDGGSVGQD